jgi:hypothetical protein
MGWISTQTSLTTDEFFKQELAVDQGDEKIIAVSGKTVLWKNTKENFFAVTYYQMVREDGEVAYKTHGASDIVVNIPLSLIRQAICLNKKAGNEKALKIATYLEEALAERLEIKKRSSLKNHSAYGIIDQLSELKKLNPSQELVLTLIDNQQVIFISSYQDYARLKRKSKFVAAFNANDGQAYKYDADCIASYHFDVTK